MTDYDDNNIPENENDSGGGIIGWLIGGALFLGGLIITGVTSFFVGKNKGYKEGFERASEIYEKKFRKQAEDFLSERKNLKEERDEYEKLIADLFDEIERLKIGDDYEGKVEDIEFLINKRQELIELQQEA